MPVNIQIEDGNFSFGPDAGFFYSIDFANQRLIRVEAGGSPAGSFIVTNSQLRNPVKDLHFDGTFFWTLEDLPSNLGIVIKKWRLFPFKTFAFPSVSPAELRWQDELTLINTPGIKWESNAFAVEHYHRTLDGSFIRGTNVIKLNSVSQLSVGDVLYLGPSTFTGFVGNEEKVTALSINTTTKEVSFSKPGGLENSYISTNPVSFHKSLFVFNDHSFSGQEDNRGALVQFSWPAKIIVKSDQGGKYAFISAADFDQTHLSWVRGPQILRLDIFNPTLDLTSSLEANLMESDLATIIPVHAMISDLGGSLYYKLQQKETTEDLGTGLFTTTTFAPEYNFQTQTTLPVVNSTALIFDTRFARPFSTGDKINIRAVVRDQFSLPVLGKSVQFSSAIAPESAAGTIGTFSPVIAVTNTSGIAVTQYTPSSTTISIQLDVEAEVL